MGATRLDDVEYARRGRERNKRVNAAHRTRLLAAGKAQTNVWLSSGLRERLEWLAVAGGVNLSAVVERLLTEALERLDGLADSVNLSAVVERLVAGGALIPGSESTDTPPVESAAVDAPAELTADTLPVDSKVERAALMAMVSGLKATGLSGADIARRLNSLGYRSARGAELNGGNILRDLRLWEQTVGENN